MGLSAEATKWIAQHHGAISAKRLGRFGLSPNQISRLVAQQQMQRVHQGVYRSLQWPDTELGRAVAACLAIPSGAISHQTAGRVWGLRRCSTNDTLELIAPTRRGRARGVVVHLVNDLERTDTVRRRDGIVVTNPVRTVCDLAARLDAEDLASAIEQVLDQHRIGFTTVLRTAQRLARPGWAGAGQLRAVLAGRAPGASPHDSHLELRLARALVRAGLPVPVAQLPIEIAADVTVHADLGYPAARLVVEVDHRTWHSGEQAALDKRRDRLVKLAGFDTVRVSDTDLRQHFERTVAEVVAIHADAARRR
jgi:hypothetical protein